MPENVQEREANAVLSALTIFLSAFLLFQLEPLIANRILPWFGGSAAVWSTCLVFYQTALLVGYLYARFVTRLPLRVQAVSHTLLLALSLTLLPIGPSVRWKPGPIENPSWLILGMLTVTIGLPFTVLSATSPLLQDWLARAGYGTPYRLFAVSNAASLIALLAYPLLVEPNLGVSQQSVWWSVLYVVFAALCALTAWRSQGAADKTAISTATPANPAASIQKGYWFALAACGSMLLLSITNHISQNIAAVPLLWVLPLAIYLLTFILAFGAGRVYRRGLWLRLLASALGIMGYAIYNISAVEPIQVTLPVALAGLFVCCMFCHGELDRARPHAADLTGFYLMIAAGGAGGAIFVGLLAPLIFRAIYELPLTLALTAAIAMLLVWREGGWTVRLLWVAVAGCMIAVFAANVRSYRENTLSMQRSFYGALRVVESARAGPEQTRTLYHGTIEHGAQFVWPPGRLRPTTYYGPDSGVGIVLRECFPAPKHVGIVGLGVGTVAAYAKQGDTFRFYEINRQVADIAESLFFYLREAHGAMRIVEGDARLSLERETGPPFDVLVLDAFSGDAIPVHLLTKEAIELYRK
ncbi:MAG: fused MFS/spermidine synthase, partial [Acidobacteriaceae bacterium]|nr:fused MFS/spermidine synthase [Acidobacteriaceae bacterium]